MITTILIDIDDTLLDFDLCAKWSMEEVAKKMKIDLPQNAFHCFKTINESLWKQMEKKEITSEDIYCVRWQMISQKLNIPFDGHEFEHHFLNYLSKSTIQVDGASELLNYLSGKYKIYAASNGPYEQQIQRMKSAKLDHYLSGYFVSERIGHAKPSKDFFDICYQETNAKNLNELLMIGDSLSADITGASDYGLKTCWFNKYHKNTSVFSDYVVYHLLEIKNFL